MKGILLLTRKNIILMKKYIIPLMIYALVLPYVFISIVESKATLIYWLASFIDFLVMLIVITNTIEMAEDKNNKVLYLLCASPYTRGEIVLSKYVFDYIIFIIYWMLIGIESLILRSNFLHIGYVGVCAIFIIVSLYRGVMIPFEIKWGYSKTKNIFTFVTFGFIFGIPLLTKVLDTDIALKFLEKCIFFKMNYLIQCIVMTIFAVLCNVISYAISINIFKNKDL